MNCFNSSECFDVFISYKWDEHKSKVHLLADHLEKNNIRIWLDRNKIKESEDLSMTMKKGIDQSQLFICCVTDRYCDFEDPKNKNCKSEFNYAFCINKKILYIIFADVKGLDEAEICSRFNAVGFRMSGNLFYKFNQSNLDEIFNVIQLKKQEIIKTAPIINYLPNQTGQYVRKRILEEQISDSFKRTNVVIITGSSGMGKTCLAVNYGREMSKNRKKVVRFINSRNKDSIFDSLLEILDLISGVDQKLKKISEKEIIEQLIFYLDKYDREFLLIIDDIKELNDLEVLFERTQTKVSYLITTNMQEIKEIGNNAVKVAMDNFDNEETYEYLKKNLTRKDRTHEICSKLAKVILETSNENNIIPIYLEQVVQYLNENKEINLMNFVANFKDEKFDFMTERLRKIKEENEKLWSMLKFASILDGSFIHYKLLKLYLNIDAEDKKTLGKLVSNAQQISILMEDYDEKNEYGIRIHQLMQKGIQNIEKSLNREIDKMAKTIDLYYSKTEFYPDYSWLNSEYSINHAKKLLENKDFKDGQLIISLNKKIARSLIIKKLQTEKGILYCKKAMELETDKTEKIELTSLMGMGFEIMGEYDEALDYHQKSLEIKLKTYSDDHPSIGDSFNNLGNIYYSKGEYDKAINYYRKSLEILLKAYKNDHPSIGDIYNNLGLVCNTKGEYEKALDYFTKSLEIKLKAYNDDHPSIGDSYNNLGIVYYSKGEYDKAIEYFKKSLEIFLKAYKNDHPSIAFTYYNLGSVYNKNEDYNKALEYYKKSLEIKLKAYNDDHPSIGDTYNNLGIVFNKNGEYEKALDYFTKSHEIKLKAYKNDHPSIGNSYNNLGIFYYSNREYDKAIEYYKKSLEIKLKAYKNDHPSIGDIYNNLGLVCNTKGEYEKALDYFTKSLEIKLKAYNDDHPSIGDSYNNLGIVYYSKGEYDKAIEYFKKSLEIFLKAYKNDHPSIVETYKNLSLSYFSKGEYEKGLDYFTKSLEIKLKAYNDDHPSIGDSYNNPGSVCDTNGDYHCDPPFDPNAFNNPVSVNDLKEEQHKVIPNSLKSKKFKSFVCCIL